MPGQILATKLYTPRPRPKIVLRPRLLERMNEALRRKLTLISAPAGFGKTTLASEWIAAGKHSAAWFSPDEGDSDPGRFVAYLIAALQTIDADFGKETLGLLGSSQQRLNDVILTNLLNEIAAMAGDFILVIDDYHVVDARPIEALTSANAATSTGALAVVDEVLAFLLEHMPPQMHLVITTREDPTLPLARLRVRGQLSELRAADLRFTVGEATEFLNQVMGLSLTAAEIAALETRTEGWVAGLQMAALSMQGRTDTETYIQAFTGSHHFIMDYLVEEILRSQPEEVRSFLLQTAILRRLSGPLCDAVVGAEESQEMLELLDRGNLLLFPLDDNRRWYRYHHLFADVLQAHLLAEQPDLVPVLHARASAWYAQNRSPAPAVHHALAAQDFERAAGLVELFWPEMSESFQESAWLSWVKKLPEDLIRARPVLCVDYAQALLNRGELEAAETRLRHAERWLGAADEREEQTAVPAAAMVIADEQRFRSLPAALASARAYLAQALGDAAGTVKYGRLALDLYAQDAHLQRGVVAAILGLAYLAQGDLEAAHSTLAEGMASMQAAGNLLFALRGTYILADIRMTQGRLRDAISTYEQLLQLASQQGEPVLRGTADLHMRLSELYVEQDNLGAAREQMQRGEELGEQAMSPVWRYRFCLAQARMKKARGELDAALDLLNEAETHYIRTPVPDLYPVEALKARVWIDQGKLAEAGQWVREQGLSFKDDLSYIREFEHITLARLALARHRRHQAGGSEAVELLERLLQAAEAGGRKGSVIEILALQALAHEAQGNMSMALAPLQRALALAEPQGYVRIFVDEGAPLARLLSAASAAEFMPDYTRKLLAVFAAEQEERSSDPARGAAPLAQPLIEPLSPRELEVLHLIAQGLTNREISDRLFLALSTVKGHNRRIFGKLAVQNRTEAAARARELGLL